MTESIMDETNGKMIVKFLCLIIKSPGSWPNRPILPAKMNKPPIRIKKTPKAISILPSSGILKEMLLKSAIGLNIQMFVNIPADHAASSGAFQKPYL